MHEARRDLSSCELAVADPNKMNEALLVAVMQWFVTGLLAAPRGVTSSTPGRGLPVLRRRRSAHSIPVAFLNTGMFLKDGWGFSF